MTLRNYVVIVGIDSPVSIKAESFDVENGCIKFYTEGRLSGAVVTRETTTVIENEPTNGS